MRITVELSLYPLTEDYVSPIKELLLRLKTYQELDIVTNAMSTQIVGEHNYVFDVLNRETAKTFSSGQSVFVMKILSFERDIKRYSK